MKYICNSRIRKVRGASRERQRGEARGIRARGKRKEEIDKVRRCE
jgi:hypothetical protein